MEIEKILGFAGKGEDDNVDFPWDFLDTVMRAERKVNWTFDIITSQRIRDQCKSFYIGIINEYDLILHHPDVNRWLINDTMKHMIFRPSYPFGKTKADIKMIEKGYIRELHTGDVE